MSFRSRTSARPLAVNVRVCSARALATTKKVHVELSLGDTRIKTSSKKAGDTTVFWNSSHGFVTSSDRDDEPLKLELFASKSRKVVGKTSIEVPRLEVGVLKDLWVFVPFVDDEARIAAEVHVCLQAEELGGRSVLDILDDEAKKTRRSLVRRSSSAVSEASTFWGKASQVTLNEIVSSLDAVKAKLSSYEASLEASSTSRRVSADSRAVQTLSGYKNELLCIQEQIDKVHGLSEDWRAQLWELTLSYLGDVYEFLSLSQSAWSFHESSTRMRRKSSSSSSYSSWKVGKAPVSAASTSDSDYASNDDDDDDLNPFESIVEGDDEIEFGATVESFELKDTEAFDSLTTKGRAVVITKPGIPRTNPEDENDSLRVSVVGFILNFTTSKMVSFSKRREVEISYSKNPSQEASLIKGVVPLPIGFYQSLNELTSRCDFRIILSPNEAFGSQGFLDAIPGDSTLVYQGSVIGDVVSHTGDIKSAANVRRNVTRRHEVELRKKINDMHVTPVRPSHKAPPRIVSGEAAAYAAKKTRKRRVARSEETLESFLESHKLIGYLDVLKSNHWNTVSDLSKISKPQVEALFPKEIEDKRRFVRALLRAGISWRPSVPTRTSQASEESLEDAAALL